MKVGPVDLPATDGGAKSVAIYLAIAAGLYLVYKAYTTATGLSSQISTNVGNAFTAVGNVIDSVKAATTDNLNIASARVSTIATGGAPPVTAADDQSQAETNRLAAAAAKADADYNATAPTMPAVDIMGNPTGTDMLVGVSDPTAYVGVPQDPGTLSPDQLAYG